MKKVRFSIACLAVWTAGAIGAFAAVDDTFNYEYEGVTLAYQVLSEDNKTCSVVAQTGDEQLRAAAQAATTVVVPQTVTFGNDTYTVTEAGTYAFAGFKMTSVTLPETLQKIGYMAFENCDGLTAVTIPAGVCFDNATKFYACDNLKDVYLKARDFNVTQHDGISFDASFDACPADLTFHVTECIYQQVKFGSKSGFVFGSEYDQEKLAAGRIVLDEDCPPQVGDMTVADVPVVNDEGIQVSTRRVFFTITNTTENQREAIVYRPAMGKSYDPATCWQEGGTVLYEEAMMPLTDADVADGYGTLVLPTTVTDLRGNTYTVTGIGACGFVTNGSVYVSGLGQVTGSYLSGIRIPKGYTRIGVKGLRGLDKLSGDLFIPSSVVQLGDEGVADGQVFPTNQGQSFYVKNLYILNNDVDHLSWYQTSADEFNTNTGSSYKEYRPTLHISPALLEKFRGDASSGIGAWCSNYYRYAREFLPLAFKEVDEYGDETIISTYTAYEPGTYELMFDNYFGLPVTFSSSDAEIAAISLDGDNTAVVVGEKTGTAVITVSAPASEYMDAVTATLTVIHKGPAELGSQTNSNTMNTAQTLTGLTKIAFGANDLAITSNGGEWVYVEDEAEAASWYAATLHDNQVYASAYAMIEEGWSTHINQDLSEGYYSNGPSGDYRLCYNPTVLTPNWGADVTEPVAGENVGGLLCFLVPAGKGTIVVKGYTDSDEAKMAIRLGLADAEPMTMAGRAGGEWGPPTSKEFTYAFDNTSGSPAWIYIYGMSLKPADNGRGHIESITYLPEGTQLAKLTIAGMAVAEGTDYASDGVSVTWQSFGGGFIGGGDPEGGDPESGGSLVPLITLDNATLSYTGGPAIELNSYDGAIIQLKGQNTVSAISVGTMNGQDWEGCRLLITADAEEEDASLTIPGNSNTGLYNYNSYIDLAGFTGSFSGQQYGIYLAGESQGDGYGGSYFTLNEGLKLELSGGTTAFRSEMCSWADIDYQSCPMLAWEPRINDDDYCDYNDQKGLFLVYYDDEETGEGEAATATYLKFGPPYFIAKTAEGVPMKFEVIDEDEKVCKVYGNWSGSRVTAVAEEYEGPVTIPETVSYEGQTYTVAEIANYAFNYCSLTSLTIPKTVSYVESEALSSCEYLTAINCYAVEPPTLEPHYSINSNTILYVPAGSKEAYLDSDWGTNWYFNYGERIEEMTTIVPGSGNVNGDTVVDADDVWATVEHILGRTPDGFDAAEADVNGDGLVTIADVALILDMIVNQ